MTMSPDQPSNAGAFLRAARPVSGAVPAPAVPGAVPAPSLSLELFPPRPGRHVTQTWGALDRLLGTRPDFASVTYRPSFVTSGTSDLGSPGRPDGPGGPHSADTTDSTGNATGTRTHVHVRRERNPAEDVVSHVLSRSEVPLMAHLTCIGYRKDSVVEIVRHFLDMGVRRFLALRGDPPRGFAAEDVAGELPHADDLVRVIREVEADYFDDGARHLQVAVAAYPADIDHGTGIEVLAAKQAAGADLAITQVFYDPEDYLALRRAALYSGVTMPILPGIIPLRPGRPGAHPGALRRGGRRCRGHRRHPHPGLRRPRRRCPRRPPLHLQPGASGTRCDLPSASGRDPQRLHPGHRRSARSPTRLPQRHPRRRPGAECSNARGDEALRRRAAALRRPPAGPPFL